VLRVLGNLLELDGFDYSSAREIRDEVESLTQGLESGAEMGGDNNTADSDTENPVLVEVPMYEVDPLVRRSPALQTTRDGQTPWRHDWS
jgi:NADH-quinone oxidoreductase subunit G